ncbi:MAG: hypothetical protein JWP08_3020 [Bryobacterales bacterium]|nr:hypothetical protein [Bryobacterales bacterium]
MRFNSVIRDPDTTTCKYLHRKDLPRFVVDEGLREHAAEFAAFSGMADLYARDAIRSAYYSQKFVWEHHAFDPITNVLAQYHKTSPAWVFVESFTGGIDGRRSVAHACLVRRYMDNCETWKSSYRLVLAFLAEIDEEPQFRKGDLKVLASGDSPALNADALWDVIFIRFSLLQEYGWHAGLEPLLWVTDRVNGALAAFDWPALREQLTDLKVDLTKLVIEHAQAEGAFFDSFESDSENA